MPERRTNITGILVGRKATGKSTYLAKLAKGFSTRTGKRSLIIDVNGAPAYKDIPLLDEKGFSTWNSNSSLRVAKFYLSDEDKMLGLIADNFKNGLLVLEDCTKYIPSNPPQNIKKMLVDNRMLNLDLFFTFHSLRKVPPFFWDLVDTIVLGKTQDRLRPSDVDRYPNFYAIQKAFEEVQRSKDQYIKRTVNTLI